DHGITDRAVGIDAAVPADANILPIKHIERNIEIARYRGKLKPAPLSYICVDIFAGCDRGIIKGRHNIRINAPRNIVKHLRLEYLDAGEHKRGLCSVSVVRRRLIRHVAEARDAAVLGLNNSEALK